MSRYTMVPRKYGAVIRFREGLSQEDVAKAMNLIKDYLDSVPAKWSDVVRKYDPDFGEPCFYIP